jgi:putative phosphoribosyl transferase
MQFIYVGNDRTIQFKDRREAGEKLSHMLMDLENEYDVIILALPRGGVEVGYEVSKQLHLPLDIIVARKIGAPFNPEFGIGAVAEEDVLYIDEDTISHIYLSKEDIQDIVKQELAEVQRRAELFRDGKTLNYVKDKRVILVDDGLATGVTALAAIEALRKLQPRQIIYASPVCAQDAANHIEAEVDRVECYSRPKDMRAIGLYYKNFTQTTDEEVLHLLMKAKKDDSYII